jgi:Rhodanese-like domain
LVEQPIRNRQVSGSSPLVGSILFRTLLISSPKTAAFSGHRSSRLLIPRTDCARSRIEDKAEPERRVRMESTISTKDLKAKLDRKESIKVVETLAPERYREAHIPGAVNIPPDKIKELAPRLLPGKDAEIVTYCANTH